MPELNSYWPNYNGTYNASDDLVAPWWVPGWTSQNPININAGSGSILGPGFPTNLNFCQVTGEYFDTNSSGIAGFLTVQMSDNITVVDGDNTFRLPQRLTGTMNQPMPFAYNNWGSGKLYVQLGHLNIELFCTDQTTSGSTITTDSGNDFFYFVTEHFLGGRTYHIKVPSASSPGPVDINSLIVAGTVKPYKYDPVFPMGDLWTPEESSTVIGKYTGV